MKLVINKSFGGFDLSLEAEECLKNWYGIDAYATSIDCVLPRHDKRLIDVVERLGSRASASYSDLKIVEVNDSKYRIVEHDGFESVETPSSIKWIEIGE